MFSVVIPVYQHERYLRQCVLSAVGSPLVSEVLLLDDGSRDGSAALARQLAGGALPKVRDVTQPDRGNRGAHATLNELVMQAKSDWIAVLNSDDVFMPARFDVIRRAMRYRQFSLAFGNVLVLDAQGRQLGQKRAMFDPQLPFPAAFDVPRMVRQREWLPLLAHQNFAATTSNMVFHKTLFEQVGGFGDFRYVHDWDFCLRAALHGPVEYIPHALTGYRVHGANTIKEDASRVEQEVRHMFEQLLGEHPELRNSAAFLDGQKHNPYLMRRTTPVLSMLLPASEGREVYAEAVASLLQDVEVTDGATTGRYVYAPLSTAQALHPMHLANALLALEFQDADLTLISHTLSEPPLVGIDGLRNAAIFRRPLQNAIVSGEGIAARLPAAVTAKVARLFPGGSTVQNLNALLPGVAFGAPTARDLPLPACLRTVVPGGKPVVFVLPALFAVGGVERLIIDMMRELAHRFRFVIITVERLHDRQGALHGAAEGLTLGFFDLAELAPPDLFPAMLERLRDVYQPALVWVPNGSPWQCDHAGDIRRIFERIPIVDQQVYDTEAGWIARYNEPGIRSYDRFIAINRKIEETFVRRYKLPPERIDMIYHSVNLDALGPLSRTSGQRARYRTNNSLPPSPRLLGWVGRFTPQKRPLEFLTFVRQCQKVHADLHFVMIGDGELGAAADGYIQDNALNNVTRVRFSNRMGELFAVMEGMLGTSQYEGLPISMLEALAMGVPIFSTDVGDVALVLAEYDAGSVTNSAWDLSRYTGGFEAWFRHLSRYRKNAELGAPSVRQRFGGKAVANQYEKSFESAINQRTGCYT